MFFCLIHNSYPGQNMLAVADKFLKINTSPPLSMVKNVSVSVLNTGTWGGGRIHNRYSKYVVNSCLLPSI